MKNLKDLGISPAPWTACNQSVTSSKNVVAATNKRDAALISATPELYEALRKVVATFGHLRSRVWKEANAALRKASGESEAAK